MIANSPRHWLVKSEPSVFSIDDLQRAGCESWDGVRNFQARNFMIDMRVGDLVLFYHSNAKPNGVAGIARVVGRARPDPTAWDPESPYHDPRASEERPIWQMVDLEFVARFPRLVPLAELKSRRGLEGMEVTRKGSRLSVQPVRPEEFKLILEMAGHREAAQD
jgi:predicted RNA-binding protein with PUA-like domain